MLGSFKLYRSSHLSENATWNDSDASYTLTKIPALCSYMTTDLDSSYIKLVHEAGDASAVWSIGNNAFCKVRYIERGATPEALTLDFVQKRMPSFKTPKVLYYIVENSVYNEFVVIEPNLEEILYFFVINHAVQCLITTFIWIY